MVGTPAGVTVAVATDAAEVPTALVAVTVNVYATPLVKPFTVHEVDADVHVNEPGVEVTVYAVTASPLLTEAVHETNALKSPRVAEGEVGASGAFAGVNDAEADDANELPIVFVALTVNV
jgi:hypothetical protein